MVPNPTPSTADLCPRCYRRSIRAGATNPVEDQSSEDRCIDRGSRVGFAFRLQAPRARPPTLDSEKWLAPGFVHWLYSRQAHAEFCKAAPCCLFTNQDGLSALGASSRAGGILPTLKGRCCKGRHQRLSRPIKGVSMHIRVRQLSSALLSLALAAILPASMQGYPAMAFAETHAPAVGDHRGAARDTNLKIFDEVWSRVRDSFYDPK